MHLPAGVPNSRFTKLRLLGKHLIYPRILNMCRHTGFFWVCKSSMSMKVWIHLKANHHTYKTTRFIKALHHRQRSLRKVWKNDRHFHSVQIYLERFEVNRTSSVLVRKSEQKNTWVWGGKCNPLSIPIPIWMNQTLAEATHRNLGAGSSGTVKDKCVSGRKSTFC